MADDAIQREGDTSVRPDTCATIAEILKLNGYASAHIGKGGRAPSHR